MTKTRRELAAEFKREALAMLEGSGRPLTQIAVELGIQPSMLRAWRAIIQGGATRPRSRSRVETTTLTSGPSPADLASQNARLKRELDRTRTERDVQKSHRHFRGGAEMRFALIEQHVGTFPVRLMCRVLAVSRRGFYAWRARPESAQVVGSRQLLDDVRRLQSHHQGRYAARECTRRCARKAAAAVVTASSD